MTASRRRIFGKGISVVLFHARALPPGDGTGRSVSAPPRVAPIIFCDRLFQDIVYCLDITGTSQKWSFSSQSHHRSSRVLNDH
jgi:hypothetical protein